MTTMAVAAAARHGDAIAGLLDACVIRHQAGGQTLLIHLLRYDGARFHFGGFAQAGLACPAGIADSVPRRQADYCFGRLAAGRALADAGWPGFQVATGSRREPLWPAGVVGAISHNHVLAAACVAPADRLRGVGIDIESALDAAAIAGVEMEVLSAEERDALRSPSALPYPMRLAIAFSAKESFYKALFPTVGHYFGFDAIRIEALDAAAGCLRFAVRQPCCPQWPAGRQGRIDFRLLDADTVLTVFAW
ncbi:MAG TPA: 4'-phosphopantetheinyl transferase superfamily protein [Burkholderiaceae bacterium]|nr:4'-phosphopantetheinyl transferase superfamily protein [Burkholderiaceae bacterium]